MPRKTLISLLSIALLTAMALTPVAEAQRDGGRRGPDQDGGRGAFRGGRGGGFTGFGGGGVAILGLLRVEAVREEVKVDENQQELVDILNDELREGRPAFPENFREMSEEERSAYLEKTRKWNEDQTAAAKDMLKVILEPAQYTRLSQISIQNQGINALLDKEVAEALNLSVEQIKQLESTREKSSEERREAMSGLFGGGRDGGFDRDAIREKMETLQKESDAKMLAVLSSDQQTAFEALKGAAFEMPERSFRGGRGGRGPGGDGGRPRRPGGDGDRPQRPE